MNASSLKLLGEPSARGGYAWTPALIRSAEAAADGGNFRLAAELWETMLGADDRIRAVVDTRTDTLLGLPLGFEPSGDGRVSGAVVNTLDGRRGDWWHAFQTSEQKLIHSWVIGLNIGLGQIVWSKREGRDVPRLYARSPRFLRWDWQTRKWMLTVADGQNTKEIEIKPGNGEWILFTPSGESRPWIHGAYRALSRWTLLKQYALQDWGYYSERHGQGTLVAEAEAIAGQSLPVGSGAAANKQNRQDIASDLQQLGANSAIALTPGFKLKLLEAQARTWESFKAQIEMADNGAAVTVLGQNLTTQAGDTGNQGAADAQSKVAHGRVKFDNEWQSVGYRSQVLEYYAEFNYGSRELAPWPCRNVTPPEDEKSKAAVRQQNAQADATLISAKIMTVNEARERNGLKKMAEDDAEGSVASPIFRYDLEFQTVTINERRKQLGLKPMPDGDRPAIALLAARPEGDGAEEEGDAAPKPAPTKGDEDEQ